MLRPLSRVKSLVLPRGRVPRTVLTGAFRGIRMQLDLTHETQVWLGLAEREVFSWLDELSAGVSTAFDIGAAYGEYTMYFLRRTAAEHVYAFEPQKSCRERLLSNLALNELEKDKRLLLSEKFVGHESKDVCIHLDSLLPNIAPPCIVKIDVDGGEVAILEGASELLRLPNIRWLIETHSEELERRCWEILRAAGYSTAIVPNAWWRWLVPELRIATQNRWMVGFQGD